jgi:hypothetical protein
LYVKVFERHGKDVRALKSAQGIEVRPGVVPVPNSDKIVVEFQ